MIALGVCVFAAGCSMCKGPAKNEVTENIIEEGSVSNEASDSIIEDKDHEEVSGLSLSDLGKAADFIDYEFIQENHEILEYDICTSPRYDYADTILAEYLREEVEEAGREAGRSDPSTVDYFLYDFNDDGLEDYLVCMSGALWSDGNGGNEVRIYVQEEGETVRMVFSGTVPLHLPDVPGLRGGHAPIAVLGMGSNDYHWLILPGTRILVYDADSGRYHYDDER